MNSINCTPMREIHIEAVHQIDILSFHTPWSEQSMLAELSNPSARYLVALKEDKVVGFGGMWFVLDEAQITNIAIHPDYRNLGIGSILLENLIKLSLKENINSITLEVRKSNINAQKLYTKFNFTVEGERKGFYLDNKEDCLIMWKHLH